MEELRDYTEEKDSNFDLKAEIYKYLAYWKWLLLGFLLGGAIAYAFNRYTIPNYRTESSLMILTDSESKSLAGSLPSGGASILSIGDNNLDNQIVTLKSKRLIRKVVDDLDHNISYYIEGNIITTEAYRNSPIALKFESPDSIINTSNISFTVTPLSANSYRLVNEDLDYNQVHKFGENIEFNSLFFSIEPINLNNVDKLNISKRVLVVIRPLEDVTAEYISKLVIGPKGKANEILSLSIIQEVGEKSEDFLDNLMYHFNIDGVKDKSQVARSTTNFIQERLERITSELDSVEGGIAQFKRENKLMDVKSGAEKYLSKSSSAEGKIFDIETQLILINSIKEELGTRDDFSILPTNLGIQEVGITGIISQYNSLVMERSALLKNATVKNPLVEEITEQLNSLKYTLRENLNIAVRNLKIQRKELSQVEIGARNKFSTFPGMEKGIRNIERQQQIKEELYLFLLQRREEAAIAFAVTSPVAKIIDPAYTIPTPVDPKPELILAGGLLLGLIIPIIVLFIVFMLDTKVHHKGDLAPLIKNIPFLGEIPKITENTSEVIQLNDRSSLAEAFRILRTNLAYLIKSKNDNKGEIIYVTSTIKGEGKTFISYNLARTLASTKRKVILLGADIRNPKLHRYTDDVVNSKGLSDYLHDYKVRVSDIINISHNDDLKVDLILSGPIPPNPAELFMSDRMKDLYKELSQIYDFVIVDTAPTMIVTDTLLISPLADTTLYVTRAGFTDKKLLDFPKDLKQQGKLKGLAVILNDVDYSKFSYGAKYGYSYGYGYGYGVDEDSRWKKLMKKFKGKP
jgi:tyrosine-protein kinase Etk/Wzc